MERRKSPRHVVGDQARAIDYATVQATEEAIVNALLAADTMTGADNYRVYAMPVDRLKTIIGKYGRPLSK